MRSHSHVSNKETIVSGREMAQPFLQRKPNPRPAQLLHVLDTRARPGPDQARTFQSCPAK